MIILSHSTFDFLSPKNNHCHSFNLLFFCLLKLKSVNLKLPYCSLFTELFDKYLEYYWDIKIEAHNAAEGCFTLLYFASKNLKSNSSSRYFCSFRKKQQHQNYCWNNFALLYLSFLLINLNNGWTTFLLRYYNAISTTSNSFRRIQEGLFSTSLPF